MTAELLAAAILTPDAPELPAPRRHDLHDVLPTADGHVAGCSCGWWSLPFRSQVEVAADFRLHQTIHNYVHSPYSGWVRG